MSIDKSREMGVGPLQRMKAGVYRTRDGGIEICRHEDDPHPRRWFAFYVEEVQTGHPRGNASVPDDNGASALNEGLGHYTLWEVVDWLERRIADVH